MTISLARISVISLNATLNPAHVSCLIDGLESTCGFVQVFLEPKGRKIHGSSKSCIFTTQPQVIHLIPPQVDHDITITGGEEDDFDA